MYRPADPAGVFGPPVFQPGRRLDRRLAAGQGGGLQSGLRRPSRQIDQVERGARGRG